MRDLQDAIRAFIDGWNDRFEPFVWTKDAETILAKPRRKTRLHRYRNISASNARYRK